jgi:hypothetical protein
MAVAMTENRSLVRASDIGLWTFCHRAWWLAQVQGAAHQNPQILHRGAEAHAEHGLQTLRARRMQQLGLWLLLGALVLLLATFAAYWLFG